MKILKDAIEILLAAEDGKVIEVRQRGIWVHLYNPKNMHQYNFSRNDYRIRPEPMEFWVDVYSNDHVEIASDKNRELYKGTPVERVVKMREVIND